MPPQLDRAAMVGTGGGEAASDAKVDVGQSFGQPE